MSLLFFKTGANILLHSSGSFFDQKIWSNSLLRCNITAPFHPFLATNWPRIPVQLSELLMIAWNMKLNKLIVVNVSFIVALWLSNMWLCAFWSSSNLLSTESLDSSSTDDHLLEINRISLFKWIQGCGTLLSIWLSWTTFWPMWSKSLVCPKLYWMRCTEL